MSIKKARKTLQNKEKFNYDILDKVANSGGKEPIHASMFGSFSARRDFPRKMLKIYEVIE